VSYDKILVAVDDSPAAERAVLAARDLAQLSHGEVWVLHLREYEAGVKTAAVLPNETPRETRTLIEGAVKVFTDAGVKVHSEVRNTIFGHAAKEIVADAKRDEVDVIVLGSRGHGDLFGLVLGSTAHKVIHLTDRPVLIVR
jgi:nucleotide-binding universal stress UspA family protein